MPIQLENRFIGCLEGLAIGDALGFPVEFMNLWEIKRIFGPQGVTGFDSIEKCLGKKFPYPDGSYSDDTQMALATARGLLNSKSTELDDIMPSIVQEYIEWQDSPENDRAPGTTCTAGIENLKKGVHWKESGIPGGKGCGAAMRTAPIGLYFLQDLEKAISVAYHAGGCTHGAHGAIEAGIAAAIAVNLAANSGVHSMKHMEIYEQTLGYLSNQPLIQKLRQVEQVLPLSNHEEALDLLGEGWIGTEAIALAFYCFLKNPTDYPKTVLMGANTNGDSDSIACIAGAISGAYNGAKSIPAEWLDRLENRKMIRQTAIALYEMRYKGHSIEKG
jgi:ADP-ribosylglycohydrolase